MNQKPRGRTSSEQIIRDIKRKTRLAGDTGHQDRGQRPRFHSNPVRRITR